MFCKAENPSLPSARDILHGLPFATEEPMNPEMLARYNPDYAQFRQFPHIHPLIWGKQEAPDQRSTEKHVVAFLGPAAAGKDTILRGITVPFTKILTHTTRKIRTHNFLERYIFVKPEQFEILQRHDEFIETLPQTSGLYGTTKIEAEHALQSVNQLVVWGGEETGLPKLWQWLTETHPAAQRHVVFVLPQMSLVALAARIIQKRGAAEAEGRIQKAVKEIVDAGSIADFLVLNPPQQQEPYDAVEATQNLFAYFLK